MRTSWRRMAVWVACVTLLAAGGCSLFDTPEPEPYTAANPGPWKDIHPSITFEAANVTKITIKVVYPSTPTDYVQRVYLLDGEGRSAGYLRFEYSAAAPEVTFDLPPGIKQITVYVVSTARGAWRSEPIAVPPPKSGAV